LVSGSEDETIRIWDPRERSCVKVIRGHSEGVTCVEVWQQCLVSASWDGTIRVWDPFNNKGECKKILKGHTKGICSLCVWDERLISGSLDKTIRIWNPQEGTLLKTICSHSKCVTSLVIWPELDLLVSGSDDSSIRLWNKHGAAVESIKKHKRAVWCLAVWHKRLVSGSVDDTIRIWESAELSQKSTPTSSKRSSIDTSAAEVKPPEVATTVL